MPYYQLVGYSWNHWANREVSRVTGSEINHVTIRVHPFYGEDSHELYVSHRKTDTWVPCKVVERAQGSSPVWSGKIRQLKTFDQLINIKNRAAWWKATEPGNIWKSYAHHYLGRRLHWEAPWTCTRLCKEILCDLGYNITEDFYPNLLIQQYIRETY